MNKYNLQPKIGTVAKVFYYKRVSTPEQANEGYSLSVQEDQVQKLEDAGEWEVLRIFDDAGKSARDLNRPDIEALLDACDDMADVVDAVVVQDTSRLCRNVRDHLEIKAFLKKRCIKLVSLDGNYDETDEGEFLDLIVAGVNELESKRTGRKTKRIMEAIFEKGLKPGQAPIGYINSFKKGVPMYIDKARKYYIKEIFRLWNTGNISLLSISEKLYQEGFRSRAGKKVGKSSIEQILKRITYAGGLKYVDQINENAQHAPIIDMADFNKAQVIFAMRNKGADRKRKHNTLLAGLVFCFKCGSQMYGEYHPKGNYYRCKECGKPYASMEVVDSSISHFFKDARFTEKGLLNMRTALMEAKQEQGESLPQQRSSLLSRKNALDMKMRKLEDKMLFNDTNIDKTRLDAQYTPLKAELTQVDEQLKLLDKPSSNLKDAEIEKIIRGLGQLGGIYKALNKIQKKHFLKFFITKVLVDCTESKVAQYELVPEFEALISGDLVRISSNWLPR